MRRTVSRLLCLALDGGSWNVFDAAIARGWMPNLGSHFRRAAVGTLRSSDPMITPVAWTSFLTGCTPPRHGIHEFFHLDPATRAIEANHSGCVRVPTLWEILAEAGRSVISLNLPMTYPPPDVPGLFVGGTDAPGLDWAFAQCPEFGREVVALRPDYTHKILWKRRPRGAAELKQVAAHNRSIFAAQAEMALLADARVDWTALLVHFHNLDSLQHRLWPELEVDGVGRAEPGWVPEVVSCLRALDEAIGRLLELAARRDAAVIAVSDHGFGPCRALVNVNGLLQLGGFQRRLAYGTRFRYRLRRLGERLRRWRARRAPGGTGRRLPRSVEGQVGCDWRRTVAYAPFGQLSGCVYLNRGRLGSEAAAERVRGEVVEMLRSVIDPETGDRLFRDAFDVAERYGLDPSAEGLPEVLGLSADGYHAQAKWSPLRNDLLRRDANLPGTHYLSGIAAIEAPGVRLGEGLELQMHDLAPTALAMLGLPVPETMEGRVAQEAFASDLPVCSRPGRLREPRAVPAELLGVGWGAEA